MSAPKAKAGTKPSHPRHSWPPWPGASFPRTPLICERGCGWTFHFEERPRVNRQSYYGRTVDVAVYVHDDGRRVESPKLVWRDVPCIARPAK